MTTLTTAAALTSAPDDAGRSLARLSARFGIAFAACQVGVMIAMAALVLPRGGRPGMDPLEWGQRVLDAETAYRVGNYAFLLAGLLLVGFLGVVHERLRRADRSGVLAAVAVVGGTIVSFVWPFAAVLHDVAIEAASSGADPRILAGWDSIAPYSLAFSAVPRIFFVGAIVIGLRLSGTAPRLQRVGIALIPLFLIGSATLVGGAFFPVLALSTLAYEIWIGALAWHWLRKD